MATLGQIVTGVQSPCFIFLMKTVLFPLPAPLLQKPVCRPRLSRSCVRRLLRGGALDEEFCCTVKVLNSFSVGAELEDVKKLQPGQPPKQAHENALSFVTGSLRDLGPAPADLSGPGALQMVRASSDYGNDSQRPPLQDLWGRNGQKFVGEFFPLYSGASRPPQGEAVLQ